MTATVKGFEKFESVGPEIDALCIEALTLAAEEAAQVAQAGSSISLEIDVQRGAGGVEGFSSGIRSRRTGHDGSRLAPYFDGGTLAGRRRKLKQARRDQWTVRRGGSAFTAHRHQIVEGEGIEAEGFFGRARSAGRKVLLARLDRGI